MVLTQSKMLTREYQFLTFKPKIKHNSQMTWKGQRKRTIIKYSKHPKYTKFYG